MKSKIQIITDPGSCHYGRIDYAKALIDASKTAGADAVKFQLFPEIMSGNNIAFPYVLFPELVEYGQSVGMPVFASVFDSASYRLVHSYCDTIKFSFQSPMNFWIKSALSDFKTVIVSGDTMNYPPEGCTKLYCIAEYPVKYIIDFDGIFERFDGFSDHTLGYSQTIRAVKAGARIIEKHIRLDAPEYDSIPDGKFAIRPAELKIMVDKIRQCCAESEEMV